MMQLTPIYNITHQKFLAIETSEGTQYHVYSPREFPGMIVYGERDGYMLHKVGSDYHLRRDGKIKVFTGGWTLEQLNNYVKEN